MASADLSVLAGLTPEQIAAVGRLFASGALPLPQAAASIPKVDRPDEIEDGELSDVEPLTPDAAGDNSVIIAQQQDNPAQLGKRRLSSPRPEQTQRSLSSEYYLRQEKQLEDFVRAMYTSGYGFNVIKNEVKDVEGLRAMYKKLSLPTEAQAATSQPVAQPRVTVAPATQANRADYLARLQAAKNKKTEIPAAQVTETKTEDKPKVKKGLDPKKNELLKLKLAALRAEQASKQLQASSALTGLMDRAGVSSKPLDSLAGSNQRVVINVSDQEVESELDDSPDDGAGVSLQDRQFDKSIASSSSGTPIDKANKLQQKMQEIEAARARLAELEERARSRPSNTTTPVASTLGAGLVPPTMPQTQAQYQFQALPPVSQTADDASSVIDDDEDEYDDIYNATDGPTTQTATLSGQAEPDEDDYAMDTADSELEDAAEKTPVNFYDGEGANEESSSDSNAEATVQGVQSAESSLDSASEQDMNGVPAAQQDSDDTDASMDISDEDEQGDQSAPMSEGSSENGSDLDE